MVQLNGNGTTTIYTSLGKGQTLAMMTLFTDIIPQGPPGITRTGPVVNRTSDANSTMKGSKPFPVHLVNYSYIAGLGFGYGAIVYAGASPKFVFATPGQCPSPLSPLVIKTGSFCGASNVDGLSSSSNATFATISITSAPIPGTSPEVMTFLTRLYASRRVSPSPPLNISFLGIPWLLPFFTPVTLRFNSSSSTYVLWAADGVGPFSMPLDNAFCGEPLAPGTKFCGMLSLSTTASNAPLEAHVLVTEAMSTNRGSAMSVDFWLIKSWDEQDTSVAILTAFVINSNIFYYAGSELPQLLITSITNNGTSVQAQGTAKTFGRLSISTCTQLNDSFCGAAAGGYAITFNPYLQLVTVASKTSFGVLSALYGFRGSSGIFNFTGFLFDSDKERTFYDVQYLLSNDTFMLSSASLQNSIMLTRGKCAPPIPDGEYCGYDERTGRRINSVFVQAGSLKMRFDNSSLPFTIFGALTSSLMGGPFHYYGNSGAFVTYSSSTRALTVTYPSDARINPRSYNYSSAYCNGLPQLGRIFNSTAVMQSTKFSNNTRIAANASGTLFVADVERHCVFSVDAVSGFVSFAAGQCDAAGYKDGDGAAAMFDTITGIVFDKSGVLYVLDSGNAVVRAVYPNGTVTTASGSPEVSGSVDGTGAAVGYLNLTGLALHPVSGRVYIAEAYRIRILNQATAAVKTYIGASAAGFLDAAGTKALLSSPGKPAFTADGLAMYFVDYGNMRLRKTNAAGSVTTVAVLEPGGFLNEAMVVAGMGPPPAIVNGVGDVIMVYGTRLYVFGAVSQLVTTYSGSYTPLLNIPNPTDLALSPNGTLFISDGPRMHALSLRQLNN